ncbi:MAG: hypothetical protein KJ578_04195 [Bacteroidetes bacterium]|nr:hypothetical protein [Bacteroidota bacterium]MBU1578940.1 hypothetical protein [Bacteroidota bacterium]MBU2466234.1 hypothetical protein [Bacteroidota bacterium]MBU2556963.1 hypothetical protein [Bacteroidota bacterium]
MQTETFTAKLFSVVFHPLLIPTWAYLGLITQGNLILLRIPFNLTWTLAGLIFMTSFLFPTLIILLMLRFKMISSLAMPLRSERIGPLIVTAIFFFMTYYLLKQLQIAPIVYLYMLGATLLTVVSSAITLWWKISLHMVGIGALAGAYAGLSILSPNNFSLLLVISLLIAGLTGTARLVLSAHKPAEVYVGFATGASLMFALFMLVGT